MSLRSIVLTLSCVALGWGSDVSWASAQTAAKPVNADKIEKLLRVTYPVADLVQGMTVAEIVKAAALGKKLEKKDGRAEWLKDLIQNTIAKDTWKAFGGNGTILYFPLGQALVVHQSREVHEEIELLLATVRMLNCCSLSVEVETRLIQVSPKTAKQMRLAMTDMGKSLEDLTSLSVEVKKYRPLVSMDDRQVQSFTDLARKDRAVKMLQLTNPLMREGQTRKMEWEFKGVSGVRYEIQPVFPVDGGVCLNVNLEVWAKADSVERRTRAAKLLPLAAGQTAVWDLGETPGWQHLFVLFTPWVGTAEQHDAKLFLGELPPITGR